MKEQAKHNVTIETNCFLLLKIFITPFEKGNKLRDDKKQINKFNLTNFLYNKVFQWKVEFSLNRD